MATVRNVSGRSLTLTAETGATLLLPPDYYGQVDNEFLWGYNRTQLIVYPSDPAQNPQTPPPDPAPQPEGNTVILADLPALPLGAARSGVSIKAAREDHEHPMPSAENVGASPIGHQHPMGEVLNLDVTLAAKASTDLSNVAIADFRAKALLAGIGATGGNLSIIAPQGLGIAASAGSSENIAREDHVHPLPSLSQLHAAADDHGHLITEISGLADWLTGTASKNHLHSSADVTDLQPLLTNKADKALTNISAADFYQKALDSGVITEAPPPTETLTLSDTAPLPLGVADAGTSPNASRGDHKHALPTPQAIGAALAAHQHTVAEVTGFDERVDDRVNELLVGGNHTGITFIYNDTTGTLSAAVGGVAAVPFNASRFLGSKAGDTAYTAMTSGDALALLQNSATPAISSGVLTLNLLNNREFNITMNQSITSLVFQNIPASGTVCKVTLVMTQDGTGGRGTTWPSAVKVAGGVFPTPSGANKTDIIGLITFNGGATWYLVPVGMNF